LLYLGNVGNSRLSAYPGIYGIFLRNFYSLFTPSLSVFTKFLQAFGYSSLCKKPTGKVMDVLMDVLYGGGIAGFFLLVWAMAHACEKLGEKS
jgi:hypothetical protein